MGSEGFKPFDETGPAETVRDFRPGQKVFDRYILKHILGRGGMGVVWLAYDEKLDQDIALKFLPEAVRLDPNAVDELKRETRRSLKLTHPNIVRIYDFVDDRYTTAISMEYVDGLTFGALRAEQPHKIFPPARLLPYIKQLGAALDYAHIETKTIHRDIKPSNLMVTTKGQIKVADFGIARSVSDSMTRITRNQGTSGTLAYMSPQQLAGLPSKPTDDVYALGATIYELLSGKPPFHTGDITYQIRELKPPRIAERREELEIEGEPIPELWEQTIAACLAKDPALRPQSAGEIFTRLNSPVPSTLYIAPSQTPPPAVPAQPVVARIRNGQPPVPPPDSEPEADIECGGEPGNEAALDEATVSPEKKRRASPLKWVAILAGLALLGLAGWHFGIGRASKTPSVNTPSQAIRPSAPKARENPPVPPHSAPQETETKLREEAAHKAELERTPQVLNVPAPPYTTIQSAINAARPGDTIRVAVGVYQERLALTNSRIKLEGADKDKTIVWCDAASGCVLEADHCIGGMISGFTFQHRGAGNADNPLNVVLLGESHVELTQCKILNGYGLLITGGTNFVHDCEIRGSSGNGIYIGSNSAPYITKNLVTQNNDFGICFYPGAAGTADGNTITQNKKSGICFEAGSAGMAENNICEANNAEGIRINGPGTTATLLKNRCADNNRCGIFYINGAQGAASDNVCQRNKEAGIFVYGSAVDLINNQCLQNSLSGIVVQNGSTGRLERNNCSNNNNSDGIFIQDTGPALKLIANQCLDNGRYGILTMRATPEITDDNVTLGNKVKDRKTL